MAENDDTVDRDAQFVGIVNQMSDEEKTTLLQLMEWIAQRPKGSERLTKEKMRGLFENIRRENTRCRLGGKVGIILPFKWPQMQNT